MFFALIQDNYVIIGPRLWNKLLFEEALQEECDITYTLPTRNDDGTPYIISDTVKILPITSLPEPAFNSKIQRLDGPYWNFSDTIAEMYFTVGDLPIDAVKNNLIALVAANRYSAEVGGIKMTIQGTEVSIDTNRGARDIFFQGYSVLGDTETVNWKFPECWMTLSKAELGTIVESIKAHVQTCFNWEQNKQVEINACQTLDQLNNIDTNYS
jgi:hypothetical protein